jgi:small-conductance mechanosensitive channel
VNVNELGEYVGTGLITAAALLLIARILLPKEERPKLRLPLLFVVLHVLLLGVDMLLGDNFASAKRFVDLTAFFLILLSIGRSGFLLVVHSVLSRRLARPLPKIFRDIIQATIFMVAILFTLQAAGLEPSSLLTTSALLTAVIGLSLQDTLGNLFAGLAIQAQRPFEVGDWVQFDDNTANIGMVMEINWRAIRVRTVEHIEITVPNNMLAKAPIRNFTRPQIEARRSIHCTAPYTTPPRQVMRLVRDAIQDVPGVLADPAPTVVPIEFDERGVRYQVRYFISDFQGRELIDGHVRERVWYALNRAEIDMPVPQRLVHLHEATQAEVDEREKRRIEARVRYLKRVDFLDGLPEDVITTLAKMSETRLYDADEAIIRQGAEDDEFFIVQKGRVAIEVHRPSQGKVTVTQLGQGQFFGEMSLMTGEKRRATVRAIDECQLLVVGKAAFHRIFDDRPELVSRISEVLALRQEQLGEIAQRPTQGKPSEQRSAELLGRIREFFSL